MGKLVARDNDGDSSLRNISLNMPKFIVSYEALNEADKDINAVMVLCIDDLIPSKGVAKANSMKGKKVFGKLFISFLLWICGSVYSSLFLLFLILFK